MLTQLSASLSGMVEMIPNAETLRKIQGEHGVTGSFKDRPLADWLQKHKPTEDEYEKVSGQRVKYTHTHTLAHTHTRTYTHRHTHTHTQSSHLSDEIGRAHV